MKRTLATVTVLSLVALFGFFPIFNLALAGGGMTLKERNSYYDDVLEIYEEYDEELQKIYDEYDEAMAQQHRPYIPGSDGEREVIMHVDPYGRTSYEIRNPDMVDRAGAGFDYRLVD